MEEGTLRFCKTAELDNFITNANNKLIDQSRIIEITYDNGNTADSKAGNVGRIQGLINGGANIYAIWSRSSNEEWGIKYIGQRSTDKLLQRINQHLFMVSEGTSSKLKQVEVELMNNRKIGLSAILVEPNYLRLSVESELIRLNKPCWNVHGNGWN